MCLTKADLHPLRSYRTSAGTVPTPWSESIWGVFINDDAQLAAAIQYVQRHPEKDGLPEQSWPFVMPASISV